MITTQRDIQDLASGWQKSRALLAAVELDLFTYAADGAADGRGAGATARQIAARAGTDPRCTDRLLRVLVTLGLMELRGDRFVNAPGPAELLVRGREAYLSNLHHLANTFGNWASLNDAVQAGTAVIDLSWDHDEGREAFIEAMHRRARFEADELVARLDLSGVVRVLDVGGGSGVYAMAMCRARPGLEAVVLDLPEVTRLTRRYVDEAGLAKRVTTSDGDYLDADFGVAAYDLVFFSAIVHINSPGENWDLMARAFACLRPGGIIAIQDFIMEEDRLDPPSGAMFALNMIVNTRAGDTYTKGEISAWLQGAGCVDIHYSGTGPSTGMITGRKQ
jgi:predicted O-methyltransferase YrrM